MAPQAQRSVSRLRVEAARKKVALLQNSLANSQVICTGDIIMLSAVRADGVRCYLRGEGIVDEDLSIIAIGDGELNESVDVQECLFRVVPQLCYTALKEWQNNEHTDSDALTAKLRHEETENAARLALCNPVRYGETLQLLHLRSGKYVTVLQKVMGRRGRGTLRVALQAGRRSSTFSVLPFYKYKGVGEPLLYDQQVIFAAQKPGPSWFLHYSLAEDGAVPVVLSMREQYELNVSTESQQGLFPKLYSRRNNNLQIGHIVKMTCPQSERTLGASCNPAGHKRPYYRRREVGGDHSIIGFWSKGAWSLEAPVRMRGGDVQWCSLAELEGPLRADMAVCLRHVGTGHYLHVDRDFRPEGATSEHGGERICQVKLAPESSESCRFFLEPLVAESGAVQLGADGRTRALLRFEDARGKLWLSYDPGLFKKSRDERPRPSLQPFFGDVRNADYALIIEYLGQTQPNFIMDATRALSWRTSFLRATASLKAIQRQTLRRSPSTGGTSYGMQKATNMIFQEIEETTKAAIRFVTKSDVADCLHCPEHSWPVAQRLVRELKLIDTSVELLDTLWDTGFKVTRMTTRTNVRLSLIPVNELPRKPELPEQQVRCLKLLLEFWRCCFQDSRENELYFSRKGWLEKINDLNGLGLGASKCLAALVSNNRQLLHDVTMQTMQKFVDFIHHLGPDETWLRFLQAVCSCRGHALPDKQQDVLQMLYRPGENANSDEKAKWGDNRQRCLLAVHLGNASKSKLPSDLARAINSENLPGKSMARLGIRDLLVSWTTSKLPWKIGADWLYFHPLHIGLEVHEKDNCGLNARDRFWVSLADLSWVLDPDYTYPALYPRNNKVAQDGELEHLKNNGSLHARQMLSKYFVAQMDMLREMCVCNQVHSMKAIQEEYSFDLLCNALWDHSLAPAMRTPFCRLLGVLWVNRHPHLALNLVPLCHTAEELRSGKAGNLWLPTFQLDPDCLDSQRSLDFDAQPSPAKFHVLVGYVRHHFNSLQGQMVHSHTDLTGYTAVVSRLFLDLVKFGFVSTEAELASIMPSLLACLDGRTDLLDGPITNLEAKSIQHEASAGREATEDTGDSLRSHHPLLTSTTPERAIATVDRNSPFLYLADGWERYQTTDESSHLIDAKVCMCEVCAAVVEIFVGNGVTQLARLFMEQRGSSKPDHMSEPPSATEVRQILEAIQPPQLDLDKLCGGDFNIMLADLMMYDSPRLFVAAAKVMRLWNRRMDEVLERATEIIILGSAAESRMYCSLKSQVARLTELISTSRDWGLANDLGPVDHEKSKQAEALLQHLRRLCSQGGEEEDTKEPNTFVQSLLASLRLGEELVKVFELPDEGGDSEGILNSFVVSVTKLIYQFVNGHARNQEVLYTHLPRLQEWNATHLQSYAASTIAGIFRGNRHLCEKLSEEVIYDICQALVHSRSNDAFQPGRLDFMISALATGKLPILRNKEIILSVLRNPAYDKVLHLMNDPAGLKRRNSLLLQFHSLPELTKPPVLRYWAGGDAELQYHNKTLQLLATLCIGRDQSGASAFVQSKMPPTQLVESYSTLLDLQRGHDCAADCLYMCSVLKRTLLAVLTHVYYDTNIMDLTFLTLRLHVVFLVVLFDDLDGLCSDVLAERLTSVNRELLFQMLRAFAALVELTPRSRWHPDVEEVATSRLNAVLERLPEQPNQDPQRDVARIRADISRILAWLSHDRESVKLQLQLQEVSDASSPGGSEQEGPCGQLSSACRVFVQHVREDPAVRAAAGRQRDTLVQDVCLLREKTDPADPAYARKLELSNGKTGNIDGGFRRNAITTLDFLQRAISHCLQAEHIQDWDTTYFVIELLCDILSSFADDGDELRKMQSMCAQCGGQRLVVDTLCGRPDSEFVQKALRLATLLLKPNNKEVQMIFTNYFFKIDDYQLWNLLGEMIEAVTSNVKPARKLKRVLPQAGGTNSRLVLTADERDCLGNFSASVKTLSHAARFMQLLCEGHNMAFQRYLRQQVDNSHSINFLEVFTRVCAGLCKNEAAADVCDDEDAGCLTICFEMLSEATTRPDERNQDFLANESNIVQCAVKILAARFIALRHTHDSCYPEPVRELKMQVSQLLLVLLEMRQDAAVHCAIISKLDAQLLIRRIIFVHRWFLSEGLDPCKTCLAICPGEGPSKGSWDTHPLDDPLSDDGIGQPSVPPEELLEGYEESELADMFGEAFNLMILAHTLEPHDSKFAAEIEPTLPSLDKSLKSRVSGQAFAEAEAAHRMASKYHAAFMFFNNWIRMIEIQAEGRVFDVYFRMPFICDYVLGREKAAILDEVSIESSEAKIKDFIARCRALYDLTLHTWSLSQWTPCPCCRLGRTITPPRPLLFWLKNDSRNLVRTTYLCYGIAMLLNALLFHGLLLREKADKYAFPEFDEHRLKLAWFIMGILYLVLMSISLFVVCLTYSPLDYAKVRRDSEASESRRWETAVPLLLAAVVALAPLLVGRGRAVVLAALLLVCRCGKTWSEDPAGCPRNAVARFLVTCYLGLRREQIIRFSGLAMTAGIAASGVYWFYTFLLLDVLFMSEKLQTVVKAVVHPLGSLLVTMTAGMILAYEFSVIAFFFFRRSYGSSCQNLVDCTVTTLYLGFRRDLGRDIEPVTVQSDHWYGRVIFDLSFFLLITTVLMNILFGIIVDTFAALRNQVKRRERYKRSTTFIASIERSWIDKAALAEGISSGFDYLEGERQHCWNYMNFIFYLRHKDKLNYMGPETRISHLIARDDISWVPLYDCSLLQRQADRLNEC